MLKAQKDFLQNINQIKEITEDSLLVSLDVKYLHSNILNNKEIQAVQEAYDKHRNKAVSTKFITAFLSWFLNLTNFIFNSANYI